MLQRERIPFYCCVTNYHQLGDSSVDSSLGQQSGVAWLGSLLRAGVGVGVGGLTERLPAAQEPREEYTSTLMHIVGQVPYGCRTEGPVALWTVTWAALSY